MNDNMNYLLELLKDSLKRYSQYELNRPLDTLLPIDTNTGLIHIVVSGSTKYKNELIKVCSDLERAGFFVLASHTYSHSDNLKLSDKEIENLHKIHEKRIQMASIMFVVNPDVKIGESTMDEIHMAENQFKPIIYLVNPDGTEEDVISYDSSINEFIGKTGIRENLVLELIRERLLLMKEECKNMVDKKLEKYF